MPFYRATSQKYTSKHEPLPAAQAAQMNLLIITTNQATLNTRNNHIYLPSVCNAPDPMRHLGQFPMLREGVRWHCAARREIAERSEEAPGAEAAQPSRNDGNWKAQAGCFGGDARGAEKGAQPHNRPRLAPRREGVPNAAEGAESRARRAVSCLSPSWGSENAPHRRSKHIPNSKKPPDQKP